jgi:hypothetical protein
MKDARDKLAGENGLNQTIESLRETIRQHDALLREFQDAQNLVVEQRDKLSKYNDTIEQRSNELLTERAELYQQIQELSLMIHQQNVEIEDSGNLLGEKQTELDSANLALQRLQTRFDTAQSQYDDLLTRCKTVQDQIRDTDSVNIQLRSSIDTLNQQSTILTRQRDNAQSKYNTLENECKGVNTTNSQLTQQLTETQDERDRLRENIQSIEAMRRSLDEQMTLMRNQLAEKLEQKIDASAPIEQQSENGNDEDKLADVNEYAGLYKLAEADLSGIKIENERLVAEMRKLRLSMEENAQKATNTNLKILEQANTTSIQFHDLWEQGEKKLVSVFNALCMTYIVYTPTLEGMYAYAKSMDGLRKSINDLRIAGEEKDAFDIESYITQVGESIKTQNIANDYGVEQPGMDFNSNPFKVDVARYAEKPMNGDYKFNPIVVCDVKLDNMELVDMASKPREKAVDVRYEWWPTNSYSESRGGYIQSVLDGLVHERKDKSNDENNVTGNNGFLIADEFARRVREYITLVRCAKYENNGPEFYEYSGMTLKKRNDKPIQSYSIEDASGDDTDADVGNDVHGTHTDEYVGAGASNNDYSGNDNDGGDAEINGADYTDDSGNDNENKQQPSPEFMSDETEDIDKVNEEEEVTEEAEEVKQQPLQETVNNYIRWCQAFGYRNRNKFFTSLTINEKKSLYEFAYNRWQTNADECRMFTDCDQPDHDPNSAFFTALRLLTT